MSAEENRPDAEAAEAIANADAVADAASEPAPTAPPKPRRSLLRRFLLWSLLLPFFLILLLVGVLGFALGTESGLQAVLALLQRVAPGELSYGQVQGRLLGALRIEQLRYQDGALKLTLGTAELDWQPRALLERQLLINRLQVADLDLQLPPSADDAPPNDPEQPLSLPDVQLPFALHIAIADAQGRNLRIQAPDLDPIIIESLQFQAATDAQGLHVQTLDVRAPQGAVQLAGSIKPVGAYPLHIAVEWRVPTPEYGELRGVGKIDGALGERLQFTQQINGIGALELNGAAWDLFSKPAWSVQTKLTLSDLKPVVAELAGNALTAELKAQGVMAEFQGSGAVQTTLPELGATKLRFAAAGNAQGIKLESLQLTTPQRALAVDVHGAMQFQELRFQLAGQWRSLVFPLTGPPQVASPQGQLNIAGIPSDYRFQLDAQVQGQDIPAGRWQISGQGSEQAVRDVTFNGETLQGVLRGTAEVAWLPDVRWQVALNGQGLNPGVQWKEMPGKLNLRLRSDGRLENRQLQTNVLLEELSGTLSGQALRGNADLAVHNDALTIRTLRLNAGANRIEASGRLAQHWDLRWTVDAPQLQTFVPNLSGTVTSSGSLSGAREQPQIAANFALRNVRHADLHIQQLSGAAQIDVAGTRRSQLKLSGEGLSFSGARWKSIKLDGAGTPAVHEVTAELVGELGRFALALSGQLRLPEGAWQGRITQLSARETVAGNWALLQPVALQAAAQRVNLENACLSSAPTRLCVQGQWTAAQGANGRVQLSDLTPERFKAFLPKGTTLATSLNAEASGSLKPNGQMQAQLRANLTPGTLQTITEGQTVRVTLKSGNLQASTDGRTANAQLALDLGPTGQLNANLRAQDPFAKARLDGTVQAAITDLSLISLFVPQVQQVAGQLRADVALRGDLSKLVLRGAIGLENAGVAIPQAGIRLQNIQVRAASTGQGPLQLSGSAQSKPGQITISGEIDPLQPKVEVQIKGQAFQAMDTTDLRIQISPDLNIRFAQQQLHVDGQVTIPDAFIRPPDSRAGPIRPSSDVVIVNGKADQQAAPRSGVAIFARVRVILGDQVLLETPAFKGRLRGSLLVEETPQLAPRGSGTIEVVAGNYKIFGEQIEIQRGRVLFSNSPLDNPGLDLRVTRPITGSNFGDDSMVGAQVRGTLRQPKLTFFSQPKMSDSEILSYLVLGRGQGGGSEAALLFKAANALGFGSDALTGSLGSTLGLDTLQFSPDTNGGGSALSLGKNLSPDLYVGYGVGLLDNVNTFTLRYRLTRRLIFESNTSALGTGVDLTYTLER